MASASSTSISKRNHWSAPLFFAALRIEIAAGLAQALLAPARHEWRLLKVDDGTAAQVQRTVLLVTAVVSFGRIAAALADMAEASWTSSDVSARALRLRRRRRDRGLRSGSARKTRMKPSRSSARAPARR